MMKKEYKYIYRYNWIILQYSRNSHNILSQLYFNNFFLKGKKEWLTVCGFSKPEKIILTKWIIRYTFPAVMTKGVAFLTFNYYMVRV